MTVSSDNRAGRVLVLLSNSLQVWDANEGKLAATVSGLKQAKFLAQLAGE
jgi:hypothetical protein